MALTQVTTGGVDENISIDSNTLKVDGTNNRIGIGTSAPGRTLDVSGVIRADGTSGALAFGGNSSTPSEGCAIHRPASDQMAFVTNNTERLRIDSSGNLLIKTGEIDLQGGNKTIKTSAGFLQVGTSGSHHTAFITGGSERMRITNSGKVGVGLTPTSATLEVSGQNAYTSSANSLTTATTKAAFRVKGSNNSSDSLWMGVETADAHPYIQGANGNGSNAKEILLNPFGGNVGIGITSPTSQSGKTLHLHNSGGQQRLHLTTNNTGSAAGDGLDIILEHNTDGDAHILNHETNGDLKLGAGDAERVRIKSTGHVNIGTTIDGFANTADNLTIGDSGNCGITIRSGTSNAGSIYFSDATSGSGEYTGYIDYHHNGNYLRFGTNGGNERMRIDSTGAVTKPTNPLIKSNMGYQYGSSGSLTASPAAAILQASAEIDRGNNGWTTSGSNAYTFVCPVDGIYAVHAHTSLGSVTTGRAIWVMGYTAGGGNLPLANYVEVMDTQVTSHENYSYFNTWYFTAGTRVGFGINGGSGAMGNHSSQWGIYLLQ